MNANHMLKYHVVVPLVIVGALLIVGVSFGTALVVGMMTGCMSMMFMHMGGSSGHRADDEPRANSEWRIER